jgi:hypothetical protein
VSHGITKPAKPFKVGACQRVGIIAQNHKSFVNHLQAVRLGAVPATAAATTRAAHNASLSSDISMMAELVSEGAVGTTYKNTGVKTSSSSTDKQKATAARIDTPAAAAAAAATAAGSGGTGCGSSSAWPAVKKSSDAAQHATTKTVSSPNKRHKSGSSTQKATISTKPSALPTSAASAAGSSSSRKQSTAAAASHRSRAPAVVDWPFDADVAQSDVIHKSIWIKWSSSTANSDINGW